jgi:hypothetical protein
LICGTSSGKIWSSFITILRLWIRIAVVEIKLLVLWRVWNPHTLTTISLMAWINLKLNLRKYGWPKRQLGKVQNFDKFD